jgi:hypothetical protein
MLLRRPGELRPGRKMNKAVTQMRNRFYRLCAPPALPIARRLKGFTGFSGFAETVAAGYAHFKAGNYPQQALHRAAN